MKQLKQIKPIHYSNYEGDCIYLEGSPGEGYYYDMDDLCCAIEGDIESIADLPQYAYACRKQYGFVPAVIDIIEQIDCRGVETVCASEIAEEYLSSCYYLCDDDLIESNDDFGKATDQLQVQIDVWLEINKGMIAISSFLDIRPITFCDWILDNALIQFKAAAQKDHYAFYRDLPQKIILEYEGRWLVDTFGE